MNAPRYATGAECVDKLREFARELTKQILIAQHTTKMRPIEYKRLDERLNTICTCIEVLTINGNYYAEKHQANVDATEVVA